MRTQDAKAIHMRDLLAALGHEPQNQTRGEWWYNSPLRQESKPSFKLSSDGRAWYDHGAGIGGNILKFTCLYFGLSEQDISGALRKLDALNIAHATSIGDPSAPSSQPSLWEDAHQKTVEAIEARRAAKAASGGLDYPKEQDDTLSVTKIVPVQSLALLAYLKQRCIDKGTAMPWVQEMHYKRGDKAYFSLVFASDSGGYELRSRGFKSAQGKKDVTLLKVGGGAQESIAVFEGFMDFLSWLQHRGSTKPEMPVLVLNSTSMRKKAVETIQAMENIKTVHLFADRDDSGKALVEYLQTHLQSTEVIDESSLYGAYHDYNEFLVSQKGQVAYMA